jgi:hypothetical protein
MPGINGIELAQKVLDYKPVPIVLHTGSWAKDTLSRLVFNGALDSLPIEIANKAYFFPDKEIYAQNLQKKVARAQEKAVRITTVDTAPLQDITKRLQVKDTLIDYIKTIYDELFTQLEQAVTQISDEIISPEKKAKIKAEKPDLTPPTTQFFLHNLRYPLQTLTMLLLPYEGNPHALQVLSIQEKMAKIKDYIESESTKFTPSLGDTIAHKKELKAQTRKPLPRNDPPTKLVMREKMLHAEGTPYVILRPEETDESQANHLFTATGKVIVRSMSTVEDNALPFAGYFDSVIAETPQDVSKALERVRTHHSKDLETFCMVRSYELPTPQDMTVLIEPWKETMYIGAVLEHPTQENMLLIEFMPRDDDENKQFLLYNTQTREINIRETDLERIESNHLAQEIAERLEAVKTIVETSKDIAYQMEIGFSVKQQDVTLYTFQLRSFQSKQEPAMFTITTPIEARTIFGATTEEGIECIIATTTDPIELDLICQRAQAEQLHLLYIAKDNKPNVPFCAKVDVLITGKDLAVQEHAYFNPLSQSQHAVLMTQSEIAALTFEPGQKVRYISNGKEAVIIKLETTEATKYKIRDILNQ